MDNYEFCAQWAAQNGGGRVLDYGCGTGKLVTFMRAAGIDASGCDVFYDGGDFSVIDEGAREHIVRMDGDLIPFPDATFDAVVSNQVLEHVPNLDIVNAEIARVLKPGGVCLHMFPHRGVWTEPHIKVPLAHRFRKGAAWRLYWVALMRALRYGSRAWPLLEMSATRLKWIDAWTHYRSCAELHRSFATRFAIEHMEAEWLDARFGPSPLPAAVKRFAVLKLAGVVIQLHSDPEDKGVER